MIGSTIIAGIAIIFSVPKNKVIVCAKVKIETCKTKGLSFGDKRNNARTNKM